MSSLFARFLKDESGATAIEYGLIAAVMAVAVVAAFNVLGTGLNDSFENLSTALGKAPTSLD